MLGTDCYLDVLNGYQLSSALVVNYILLIEGKISIY